MRTALIVLSALVVAGCATSQTAGEAAKPTIAASAEPIQKADLPEPSVAYYSGTVQVSSPDGAKVYGTAPALVKRELRPSEGLIIETTLDEGKMRVTTLKQTSTNVFEASDDANSFTGTITFAPNPWKPIAWTYDLQMADGSGSIQGNATVTATGITTIKVFVGPDGQKQAQIVDKLQVTTPEDYQAAVPQ